MPSRPQSTRRIVVALDGPASSGKSSVGAAAAEQLDLRFVDTGLFYRALTALALLEGVPLDDARALVPLIDRISLGDDGSGRLTRVLLDGADATDEARSAVVDGSVSTVARIPEVREALLERQRSLAAEGGIVMAGRDVGTVVLPEADLKLFLDASVEERARRRIEERGLDPAGDEAEEVREQLRVRDAIDTGREVAPLRAADDAVHVRTDGNEFGETVEIVAAEIASVMMTPRPRTRSARPKVDAPAVSDPTEVVAVAAAAEAVDPAPKPRRVRTPRVEAAKSESTKPTRTRTRKAAPAAEVEAAVDVDTAPDVELEAATVPRPAAAVDAQPEVEHEAPPEPTSTAPTRRSQKRARATARRAATAGEAAAATGEAASETEGVADPGNSAPTRRSLKRTRATARRADARSAAGTEPEPLAPEGIDAAEEQTDTERIGQAPPPAPPTRRSQKRARATARRAAVVAVATDQAPAPPPEGGTGPSGGDWSHPEVQVPAAAPVAGVARPARRPAHAPRERDAILEAAMNLDNDQTMMVRMIALISRIGARMFADVDVQGLNHVPRRGAVILAANHISNADPVVVGAWITDALKRRRIHWLGKRELFSWPVFGWLAAHGGVHPVDRDAADIEAFRLATKILEQGYVLLVFPEGTRSPTGELQEAKDGVAMLALRTGAQIVPIGVSNTDAVWRKGTRVPSPFPRRTVTVRIGLPFRVQDVIPSGTSRREAKSIATTEIMGRIAGLIDPRHRGVYADATRPDLTRTG